MPLDASIPASEKYLPLGGESMALIEPHGVSLRVEHDFRQPSLCGPRTSSVKMALPTPRARQLASTAIRPMCPSGNRRPVPIGTPPCPRRARAGKPRRNRPIRVRAEPAAPGRIPPRGCAAGLRGRAPSQRVARERNELMPPIIMAAPVPYWHACPARNFSDEVHRAA